MTIRPDQLQEADFPVEFGRYTLLGLLGEGGMARVFRAELTGPSGFRKAVAIKIIRGDIATRSEELRRSLNNEARLGGQLQHPNVANTMDFGEIDGQPYIAMELVRGVGLDEALRRLGRLPPALAVDIVLQICAGLDHAHNLEDADVDATLVHRDLKPSNVFLSRDGLAKVMDFGIAKATELYDGNTQTGMTKGTPGYMSPEQVGGEDLDPRSDLFAVGAILYELLSGQRFFTGETIMSVLMGVIEVDERVEAQGAVARFDAVAPGLGEAIGRCLRRDRTQRWSSAAELEAHLKGVARTLPPALDLKSVVRQLLSDEPDPELPVGDLPPFQNTEPLSQAQTARGSAPGVQADVPGTTRAMKVGAPGSPPEPSEAPSEAPTRAMAPSMRAGAVPEARTGRGGNLGLLVLLGGGLLACVGVAAVVLSRGGEAEQPAVVEGPTEPTGDQSPASPPSAASPPPTPTEPATPELHPEVRERPAPTRPAPPPRPAAARLTITSARARVAGRLLRISAKVPGAPGATVTAHIRQGGAWTPTELRSSGKGGFNGSVAVTPGVVQWYVAATNDDRTASFGSRAKPREVTVR